MSHLSSASAIDRVPSIWVLCLAQSQLQTPPLSLEVILEDPTLPVSPAVEVEEPAATEIVAAEDTHASCGLDYHSCNTYELQPNRDQCGTCYIEGTAELEEYPSSASGTRRSWTTVKTSRRRPLLLLLLQLLLSLPILICPHIIVFNNHTSPEGILIVH